MRTLRNEVLFDERVLELSHKDISYQSILQAMNILDVTEDKIFKTLGKGKDPNYKPVKKADDVKNAKPFDFTSLLR